SFAAEVPSAAFLFRTDTSQPARPCGARRETLRGLRVSGQTEIAFRGPSSRVLLWSAFCSPRLQANWPAHRTERSRGINHIAIRGISPASGGYLDEDLPRSHEVRPGPDGRVLRRKPSRSRKDHRYGFRRARVRIPRAPTERRSFRRGTVRDRRNG